MQRVVACQVSAQQIRICQVTTQSCSENVEKANRHTLFSHLLQAFTSTEKGEEHSKKQKEQGSETVYSSTRATPTPGRPQWIAPTRPPLLADPRSVPAR